MSYLSQFHHQISGNANGAKLVFLHGVMGFGLNWRRIVRAFEDRYQILTFDQRGHGRSFHPTYGYAPADYAYDLFEILNDINWSAITLVGHSMGGRNALEFATQHSAMVQRLVIEDIGPGMNQAGSDLILDLIDSVPVPFASKREAKIFFETEFIAKFSDRPNVGGLAQFLFMNIIENERGQGVWRFSESGVRESVRQGRSQERWDDVASLTMPTLVVRGELSKDLPRDIFQRMIKCNQKIEGVEIEGAGHWVHSDKPEEFIAAMEKFFVSHPVS